MVNLNKLSTVLATYTLVVVLVLLMPIKAAAADATINPTASAKVSFTFDDGLDSTIAQAAPTLAKYGYSGTAYITTGCVGMTTSPNSCHADTDAKYITWDQIAQLKTTYGWEIGSHTSTHPYLASFDASDGQPNKLTVEQVKQELVTSKSTLAAHGYDARSIASPYGDYDMPTLAEIAKNYETHRGFADTGYNTWPNSEYILRVQQVQAGVTVAKVKQYIDTAIANKQWLVLVFHDVKTKASTNPDDYQYNTKDLDQIAAYVKSKNLPVVNPSSAIVKSDVNLLSNGSFNSGIGGGWTTDTPTSVAANSSNNGSYPDPTNSIKFTPTTGKNSHLFSPAVAVDYNTTYMLKNFINVQTVTSGELGFYIDEYDSSGNWISGQWKGAERSVFVENYNFSYKPSSAAVSTSKLQVYTTANSGITGYLDNSQWFPLINTTPVQTNLVANGTFDAGISNGWTTDSSINVVADTGSNGSPSNIVNSIKMTSGTKNIHLLSPRVDVLPSNTYNISTYVRLLQINNGELGFYIDEYDSSGNWISGQWKGAQYSANTGNISYNYKPTSANVKKTSLQIYITGNSGVTSYIDNVNWVKL